MIGSNGTGCSTSKLRKIQPHTPNQRVLSTALGQYFTSWCCLPTPEIPRRIRTCSVKGSFYLPSAFRVANARYLGTVCIFLGALASDKAFAYSIRAFSDILEGVTSKSFLGASPQTPFSGEIPLAKGKMLIGTDM